MLRDPDSAPRWLRRLFDYAQTPAYVPVRAAALRRCPDCRASYEVRDRYCPGCKTAVPEWRFG